MRRYSVQCTYIEIYYLTTKVLFLNIVLVEWNVLIITYIYIYMCLIATSYILYNLIF